MCSFIIKRILQAIPVLFIVTTITFFMIRTAPGGPFSAEKEVPPKILKKLNNHYGLNNPMWKQYLDYLYNVCKGDLGPSFRYANRSVNSIIAKTFPVSLELGAMAIGFAIIVGLLLGIIAATSPNSLRDYSSMTVAIFGICIPDFVLGPILVWIFALHLGWFDVIGWDTLGDSVLPTITLGFIYAANIARLCRGSMVEMLSQNFIRTARAKGLSEKLITIKHALRGSLLSVVSYIGPTAAGVITGSFVVETIYQIPGLGRIFVQAAFNRDYTLIVGTVLFYAFIIVLLNIIVDIVLVLLEPKRDFSS